MKRRWIWVLLFIFTVALIAILATGWNLVLVRDYHRILELAHDLSSSGQQQEPAPWLALVLGTLGFAGALGGMVLLFVKLLREMRLNQLQSEFIATVSHELKTPIATLELSSSLLKEEGNSADDTRRLWSSHDQELKRLREEVETLLEAARWQSGPMKFSKNPQALEAWLEQSWSRWKNMLGPRAVLERRGDPLDCQALLDLRMMSLITDNLMDNARKFSRDTPRVVIESRVIRPSSRLRRARWEISIRDDGWGFAPEDSERIFQRFYRSKNQAPYAIPGTGLGLFLASSASRALGITIRAESEGVGKGAVFTLAGREARA